MESRFARVIRHRMRVYYLPLAAGVVLAVSAFMPRVRLGEVAVGGVPAMSALSILALGIVAMVLASLSVITRKNSRHPLLLVGLIALAIEFLGWQWMEHSVVEQAWASAQATAIVNGEKAVEPASTTRALGLYLGVTSAAIITAFGLTIVVKQVTTPYATPDDDL